jgi:pimeloyl-ACP methyl ester carboxylesterase
MSQGGPIAITYAARHAERVSHLVIFGTCASGTWRPAGQTERRWRVALGELIRLSWGSDQPGFMQVYDAKFLPDGPLDLWRAFDTLQHRSTSAENAYQLWRCPVAASSHWTAPTTFCRRPNRPSPGSYTRLASSFEAGPEWGSRWPTQRR